MLGELSEVAWCRRTVYLTHDSAEALSQSTPGAHPVDQSLRAVLQGTGASETGLALFLGDSRAVAVDPPFPVVADAEAEGADTSPLVDLINADLCLGVVLLRLGRYGVGVLRGDRLVASKVGSRYVKSRHRAGGSSQRRFERSRERLVRELFDKTCEVAQGVLAPFNKDLDYVLMGGERHTLGAFVRRCRYMQGLEAKTLGRKLEVSRPGQAALEGISTEVWKSRVVIFEA